jgi:hypothetical protein
MPTSCHTSALLGRYQLDVPLLRYPSRCCDLTALHNPVKIFTTSLRGLHDHWNALHGKFSMAQQVPMVLILHFCSLRSTCGLAAAPLFSDRVLPKCSVVHLYPLIFSVPACLSLLQVSSILAGFRLGAERLGDSTHDGPEVSPSRRDLW